MFWMGRNNGFVLADMPIDAEMIWGMALIVAGIGVAGYGLLPRKLVSGASEPEVTVSAPEDAPLGPAHWHLMIVLTVACGRRRDAGPRPAGDGRAGLIPAQDARRRA